MKTIRTLIVQLRCDLKYQDKTVEQTVDQILRLLEYITDHICVGGDHEPIADEEITWEDE